MVKKFNLERVILMFYHLMVMDGVKQITPMRHSHERWVADFTEFKDKFSKTLAIILFDYGVKAIAGELRHTSLQSNAELLCWDTDSNCREEVFVFCESFSPKEILRLGGIIFSSKVIWEDYFGGNKWEDVVKGIFRYYALPSMVFIDHAVDLSHNNSTLFDKSNMAFYLNSRGSYELILDDKRYLTPKEYLSAYNISCWEIVNLFKRGQNIGVIPNDLPPLKWGKIFHRDCETMMNYTPVKWGTERFIEGVDYKLPKNIWEED